MINKNLHATDAAVADVQDGATIMIGGFGPAGQPYALLEALVRHRPRNLTLISNNAGNGDSGLAALLKAGCVGKIICSFPRQTDSWIFDDLYRRGRIELELVPQGTLVARIQAAGCGYGGIYTPTGFGTELAAGKETREINGRQYVLEMPLRADFALIEAERGDSWGNLVYRKAARNFGPIMAMAAACTVAEVHFLASPGELDPEAVVTPGIFVQRVVVTDHRTTPLLT
ncbi:3-oxoacid CoA-transferase subunit A [Pantoea coffeiphila]|uniref:3-oxoacid CoA-transferase subunit A n=1 Tax=Pantoea coffeiphila TaxID=1465635 RepID=UPI001961C90D|nr:3-oxoacid CoA-transferase subunit A [Pantoea coffeiphila]MBM7345372.1 3-oxoadipate CoA-transferase alpha subunit [Pantoea coffeiphila]